MSRPSRIGATLLGASLALSLVACGGTTQQPTTQSASSAQEQADEGVTEDKPMVTQDGEVLEDDASMPDTAAVEGFPLEPAVYSMISYGSKDTAAAVDEYLNSGYTAAAYQLVLYDDGSGLLYEGRSFRGVLFTEEELTVEGTPATFNADERRFALTVDGVDMIFGRTSVSPSVHQVNTALAGAYVEHDEDGGVLDRMRLRDDGTGAYQAAGSARTTLHWGTDPVFGHEYVIIDGATYRFTYRRDSADGTGYDITILDAKRTLLVPAKK